MQHIFDEFPPVSKEEWLQKIEKDLRGKPYADLQWQLEDNLQLDPLYHPDDEIPAVSVPWNGKKDNEWEIGEYIIDNQATEANKLALNALEGGAQALLFRLKKEIKKEGLSDLLNGIEMDMISTHFEQFYADKDPAQLLQLIFEHLKKVGKDPSTIEGSIDFDPILDWVDPPMEKMKECIEFCQKNMPRFKILQVNGREYHGGNEYSSRELGYILAKGNEYLSYLSAQGLEPGLVNQHMQFAISISTSFFVEIAKLRAFRLMWGNVLKAHGVDPNETPPIEVHLAAETQVEDIHTNMIRATTQAMSAVIGGANRLYVRPANMVKKENPTPFTLRIARNVQHLLKMESYLDRVIDPGAGSYYIEALTHKLAEEAWGKFQEIEAKEEFSL
jgi:methylmalonyl-CoA mutase